MNLETVSDGRERPSEFSVKLFSRSDIGNHVKTIGDHTIGTMGTKAPSDKDANGLEGSRNNQRS